MRAMHALRNAAVALLLLASALHAQGKNLLFYGNSLSFFNGGVAPIVRAIAIQAGLPAPTYQERLFSGQDLPYHATNPAQVAAISNFLPPGQTWDVVIMQGLSTEPTQALGQPALFVSSAVTILGNVRNHSPAAKAVLYQTWARGQGHSFYPTYFPNPLAMHNEVRSRYRDAATALRTAFGINAAVNSAVGDCAALLEFNPAYYVSDLQHPANSLTVLASMCLFTSIYSQRVSDITPTFSPASPLGALLNNYGITATDWWRLAGLADVCAAPALRRYPGSGDQLLLETGSVPGLLSASPRNALTIGSLAQLRLSSRNGVYTNAPAFLLARLFPTGQPPAPYVAFPELAIDPAMMAVLLTAPNLATPLTLSVPMPFTLPGASVLVQGLALGPSAETGNPSFTTTDGHEFMFQ
jgi:hypothetical protein